MGQALNHAQEHLSALSLTNLPGLNRALRFARVRLRCQHALSVAIKVAWVVLPLLFLEALAARIWAIPNASLLRATIFGLPVLGGLLAWARPHSASEIALTADRELGAESLILALRPKALEISDKPARRLQPLLEERAEHLFSQQQAASAYGEFLRQLKAIPAPLVLLALATIAISWAPGRLSRTPAPLLPQQLREQAAQLQAKAQRNAASGALDQASKDAVKRLSATLKDQSTDRSDLEQALQALEEALSAAHQDWNAFEAQAQENPLLQPLTQALKAGDRAQALAAIQSLTTKIRDGTLKATLVKQTAEALMQAAGQASDASLSNRLRQAADALAAGDGQGSEAALNSLLTLLAPPPPQARALKTSVVALRASSGSADPNKRSANPAVASGSATPLSPNPSITPDGAPAYSSAESLSDEQRRILKRYFDR